MKINWSAIQKMHALSNRSLCTGEERQLSDSEILAINESFKSIEKNIEVVTHYFDSAQIRFKQVK